MKKLNWSKPSLRNILSGIELKRYCSDFPDFELTWQTRHWFSVDENEKVVVRTVSAYTLWQPHFMKSFVTEAELRRYLRSILDKKK